MFIHGGNPLVRMYFSPDERSSGRSTHPNMNKPFTAADLPMSEDGTIYHLNVKASQVAPHILVVGDPGRAKAIGEEFFEKSSIEVDVEHRGLRTVTGVCKKTGQRVTACTHQMGTGSTEIVITELFLLASVDPKTRLLKPRDEVPDLNIIRIGTSGSLKPEVPIGSLIVTRLSVGLDNSGMFIEVPISKELLKLEDDLHREVDSWIRDESRFKGKIFPYVSCPDQDITDTLISISKSKGYSVFEGITASNSGFFASQGRDVLYSHLTIPDIDRRVYELGEVFEGLSFFNMEMEASIINHLAQGNGHKTGAICIGIANRAENTFDTNYKENVHYATEVAVETLARAA